MANGNNISRESNAELLRLVCMFMIVLGHLITKGAYPEIFIGGIRSIASFSFLFIEGLVIVAVNVFVLISGYYGINFSLKKFFSLYFICAFYGLLDYLLQKTQLNEPIGWGIIRSTFFPFFHSPYWFITCYVGLLCFAPVLNYFIRNSSKREFIIIVALSSFINIWLGFFGHNQLLNVDGYNFVHFLYIYILGGTIRRFHTIKKQHNTEYLVSDCI